jgi:hypothetical protein
VDSREAFVKGNNNIYDNTISDCWIGIQAATYATTGELNDCNYRNNICSGNDIELRVSDGAANDETNGSGNVYNNNCLGAESAGFLSWGGSAYSTYDTWLAASSQTDDNVEADPSFTNAGSDDYSLASNSPCIGEGVNLGSLYDTGLLPSSTWPDSVLTADRDDY